MANEETSFADRITRAKALQASIAGFTPAFVPQDANLTPNAFNSYITGTEAANDAVSDAEADLDPLIQQRNVDTAALRDKALRVKDFITAVAAWKSNHTTIKRAADKVRGYRPSKKAVVTPPGTTPPPATPVPKGSRTQQGYGDIERLFKKLIEAVEKISGYTAPAASGLTLVELNTQHTAYQTLNTNTATAEADLDEAQRNRKNYYDGENGLKDKMKAIKKAVRAQYGSSSDQYNSVKGIKV